MQKKKYALIALLLGVIGLGGVATLGASHTQQASVMGMQATVAAPTPTSAPTLTPISSPTETPIPTTYIAPTHQTSTYVQPTATQQSGLSNNNYYTNSSGNQVHSPAYTTDSSVPSGATAKCGDGTYSFSQHRSGTCSRHGGVAQWL